MYIMCVVGINYFVYVIILSVSHNCVYVVVIVLL